MHIPIGLVSLYSIWGVFWKCASSIWRRSMLDARSRTCLDRQSLRSPTASKGPSSRRKVCGMHTFEDLVFTFSFLSDGSATSHSMPYRLCLCSTFL